MDTFSPLSLIAGLAFAVSLPGCGEKAPPVRAPAVPAMPAVPEKPPAVYAAKQLVGQWNGPEGTYLLVAGANGRYALTIRNLDGARTFQGIGGGDRIQFERDGKQLAIHATDGAGTGMKWLGDKKHCVVIEPGEGYCRD